MPGGLLSLKAIGNQNTFFTNNPKKTFFKHSYLRHTNFALQKFRIDFDGSKTLRLNEESTFEFTVPRNGDLLMDTYIVMQLPNIWSPIVPQIEGSNLMIPYEFKWIEYLGLQMISELSLEAGNQQLTKFSGNYLVAMVERDFTAEKKELLNRMIGNVPELTDPANYGTRNGIYPSAYFNDNDIKSNPSILGRTLYIPLNLWFNLDSHMAFPLIAMQNNSLKIKIRFRPIRELFVIRDIFDDANKYPYVSPNFNQYYMQFYRFIQPPPDTVLTIDSYEDIRCLWNTNIHLNATYAFLSSEERYVFSQIEQNYLIKQVHETRHLNITGSHKVDLDSIGMVTNWMFYFQRSDINLRNEWCNYTNFEYKNPPIDIYKTTMINILTYEYLYLSMEYNSKFKKDILVNLAILLNGDYRENSQIDGVFNYLEKYTRTSGNAKDGLYCYNFCLDTNTKPLQPCGGTNLSMFRDVQFEFTTLTPPLNLLAETKTICDPITGVTIGINKTTWDIYQYNFDLLVFEERWNIISFIGGNCGLKWAL